MVSEEEIRKSLEGQYSRQEVKQVLMEEGYNEREAENLISKALKDESSNSSWSRDKKTERRSTGQKSSSKINPNHDDHQNRDSNSKQDENLQETVDKNENDGGLILGFQKLSWNAMFAASLIFYALFEIGVAGNSISSRALGLTDERFIILAAGFAGLFVSHALIGIYKLLIKRSRKGILPLLSSISITAAAVSFLIFTTDIELASNSAVYFSSSIYRGLSEVSLELNLIMNGSLVLMAIVSMLYMRSDWGRYSLVILLLPLVVIGGSYGYTNLTVSNAVDSYEETQIEHPYFNSYSIPEEELQSAASSPPPLNRPRLIKTSMELLRKAENYRGLGSYTKSYKAPVTLCSRNLTPPNHDNVVDGILGIYQSRDNVGNEKSGYFKNAIEDYCAAESCDSSNSQEAMKRYGEVVSSQRDMMEKIHGKKAPEVNLDYSPECSGSEKYKVRIKDFRCSGKPKITVENQEGTITDQNIELSRLDGEVVSSSYKSESVQNWEEGEERTFSFEFSDYFKSYRNESSLGSPESNTTEINFEDSNIQFKTECSLD